MPSFDESEVVQIPHQDAVRVAMAASRLTAGGREQAEAATVLGCTLPGSLAVAVHRFRGRGSEHNALLIRGLPVETGTSLPPTPGTALPPPLGAAGDAAGLVLLAVMAQFGEPFTFRSLYEGRLVQHVTPARGRELEQTSEGSSQLDWHVEDAFTGDRCDYFGLLCLRGHPGAATLLSAARTLDLPAGAERVLREPRFTVTPDAAHGSNLAAGHAVPVLTGPEDDPEICYDAVYQAPASPADHEAATALRELAAAIDRNAIAHELQPGELLIVDNRRVVHGRTHFQPRYDGRDRWLLRAMACASVRTHRRRGGLRAIA